MEKFVKRCENCCDHVINFLNEEIPEFMEKVEFPGDFYKRDITRFPCREYSYPNRFCVNSKLLEAPEIPEICINDFERHCSALKDEKLDFWDDVTSMDVAFKYGLKSYEKWRADVESGDIPTIMYEGFPDLLGESSRENIIKATNILELIDFEYPHVLYIFHLMIECLATINCSGSWNKCASSIYVMGGGIRRYMRDEISDSHNIIKFLVYLSDTEYGKMKPKQAWNLLKDDFFKKVEKYEEDNPNYWMCLNSRALAKNNYLRESSATIYSIYNPRNKSARK